MRSLEERIAQNLPGLGWRSRSNTKGEDMDGTKDTWGLGVPAVTKGEALTNEGCELGQGACRQRLQEGPGPLLCWVPCVCPSSCWQLWCSIAGDRLGG